MSAAKHTPGPWSASKIDDRAAFNIFTPGQCSALLTLEPGKHDGADPRAINVEADARLIAAAPCLLEALRAAYEALGISYPLHSSDMDKRGAILAQARAAIAKATGEGA